MNDRTTNRSNDLWLRVSDKLLGLVSLFRSEIPGIRAKLQTHNDIQGQKVYFHRIIVEEPADSSKHTFTVKCVITEVVVKPGISIQANHTAVRRSVLPAGFQEPE